MYEYVVSFKNGICSHFHLLSHGKFVKQSYLEHLYYNVRISGRKVIYTIFAEKQYSIYKIANDIFVQNGSAVRAWFVSFNLIISGIVVQLTSFCLVCRMHSSGIWFQKS